MQPIPFSFSVPFAKLFFFFTLTIPLAVSFQSTIFVGRVNQRDVNKPFYEVYLPKIGLHHSTERPVRLASPVTPTKMVSAQGQTFTCMVPSPTTAEATPAVTDPTAIFDDIDELFSEYEHKCFVRHEDWWTYTFCFGKHVIQKHNIPGDRKPFKDEVEDEFILGLFDREADRIRRKNASQVATPDAAFTQLFTNGTVCDMTNKPRRVTVKYLCSEDVVQLGGTSSRKAETSHLNVINAIREIESCVYEIEFINAAICQHPTYRAKLERNSRPIHCSLEDGQQSFKGLSSKSYSRSSLSL